MIRISLMFVLLLASCGTREAFEIGDQKISLPKGVEVVGPDRSVSAHFDQDVGVRLVLNAEAEGVLGSIRDHLEPFDPFQGPAIDVMEIRYITPERVENLDTTMFVPEAEMYGLSGFGWREKMIMLKYFYPDGRLAAFCADRDSGVICTKTNYYEKIAVQYQFSHSNFGLINEIDQAIEDFMGE